jgi:hypothetical protein
MTKKGAISLTSLIAGTLLSLMALWSKCDLPIPATTDDVKTLDVRQTELAIEHYSDKERDLRREELDLFIRVEQDFTENPVLQTLLRQRLEDTKIEKEQAQRKRKEYEEHSKDF